MARPKFDVKLAETRFVTGTESIRAIAQDLGMSYSAVAEQARKHDWAAKRSAYQNGVSTAVVERVADRWIDQKGEIVDEMLVVLRKAIRKFYERLDDTENPIYIGAKDLPPMMNQMLLLLGEPTSRTENRNLGLSFSAELDPAVLRRLEELTRGDAAGGGDGTPRSYLEGAGPH